MGQHTAARAAISVAASSGVLYTANVSLIDQGQHGSTRVYFRIGRRRGACCRGSLSRKAIYLAALPPVSLADTTQANAVPAVAAPASPPAIVPSATAIDPALVGTWEIMVPSGRGQSRWIWQMIGDGTYKFHAEGGRAVPSHEGTIAAANGRWTLNALRGLSKDYSDDGSYEIHRTIAVITGKLGTGYWKRSVE